MSNSRGFTIIEVLLYMVLSTLLVVLAMQALATFERLVISRSGFAVYKAALYAGIDSMVRDCSRAPAEPQMWVINRSDTITWQTDYGVEGFTIKHGTLMRVSRSRDQKGKLRAPYSSTLLTQVHGSFTVYRSHNFISMIHLALTARFRDMQISIFRNIRLHEGIVS